MLASACLQLLQLMCETKPVRWGKPASQRAPGPFPALPSAFGPGSSHHHHHCTSSRTPRRGGLDPLPSRRVWEEDKGSSYHLHPRVCPAIMFLLSWLHSNLQDSSILPQHTWEMHQETPRLEQDGTLSQSVACIAQQATSSLQMQIHSAQLQVVCTDPPPPVPCSSYGGELSGGAPAWPAKSCLLTTEIYWFLGKEPFSISEEVKKSAAVGSGDLQSSHKL